MKNHKNIGRAILFVKSIIFIFVVTVLLGTTFFMFAQNTNNLNTSNNVTTAEEFVVNAVPVSQSNLRAEAWDRTKVYNGGMEVSHNGSIWRAQYWTQGDEPGVAAVWVWVNAVDPTPTVPPPTPNNNAVQFEVRDVPSQAAAGSKIEITVDFKNVSEYEIQDAKASLTMPQGATLVNYDWNTATQPVNGIGSMLAYKTLPPLPPQVYAYGSDDFNNTMEQIKGHIKPLEENNLRMTANVLAGSFYFEAWDPVLTSYYDLNLIDYMKSRNYELSAHTFHHSHMGLDLHLNYQWCDDKSPVRKWKRGETWGVANTAQEEMMEITLGKYWNEIYFDRRMEGFRSPFLEFNIPEGKETTTKSPLRSSKWKVIGKAGLRYVCTVNEAPNPYQTGDLTPSSVAENKLDSRCAIPSWPALCDEVSVASSPTEGYTDFSHNVHNVFVGTQRLTINGSIEWGTIFDGSLMDEEKFSYQDCLNFFKRYIDRHYQTAQPEVPQAQITGVAGGMNIQRNIPVSMGLHASYTNNDLDAWADENVRNNQWVYDVQDYIKANYKDAKNVTHKDILDYYMGMGTIRWIVNLPETPGVHTFTVTAPGGAAKSYSVEVKTPEQFYNGVESRVVRVNSAAEVADKKAKGYTDVLYIVKGATGPADIAGLDSVIAAANAVNMGVLAEIAVFKDTDMHTGQTLDHTGSVVAHIAEPVDTAYRNALKSLVQSLNSKNIKGVILDAEIPSDHGDGGTFGYSDAMLAHFEKFFGPPPAGTNSQDPTSESDPLHWSIYTAAATDDWREADIPWLYYDIKQLANTFLTSGDMQNLGPDKNGVRVVDWKLCTYADQSDNTGVSSWDEWEAWGEYRRYMVADFVNEVAGGSSKAVYALVKGYESAFSLQANAVLGTATDPVEFAAPSRRPNMLPDMWNQQKGQNLKGILYKVDGAETPYITACVDLGRKIDYWVAKGGNTNRGMMPENEYRPSNDTTVYGTYLDTSLTDATVFNTVRFAGAVANGKAPSLVIVSDDKDSTPVKKNVALNKPVVSSKDFASAYKKEFAVDGNVNTVWGSGKATDGQQWIYVDLGKQYTIEEVNLHWYGQYYARNYEIGGSNDLKTWTLSGNISQSAPGSKTVPGGGLKVRYIGVLCKNTPEVAYGLGEMEVMSYDN